MKKFWPILRLVLILVIANFTVGQSIVSAQTSWTASGRIYTPNYEKDFGIKLEQYDSSQNLFTVDEENGTIAAKYVDLELPAPGQLKFGITRIYNSRCAEVDQIFKIDVKDKYVTIKPSDIRGSLNGISTSYEAEDTSFDTFGLGWRLNLPYICSLNHYHSFNGAAIPVNLPSKVGQKLTTHNEDGDLTIERIQLNNKEGYIVTEKSGTRITLEITDSGARPIKITEIGSSYFQTVTYDGPRITSIVDSLGRELIFEYQYVKKLENRTVNGIKSITLKTQYGSDKILEYSYDDTNGELVTSINNKTKDYYEYHYQQFNVTRGHKFEREVKPKVGLYYDYAIVSTLGNHDIWVLNQVTDRYGRNNVVEYDVKRLHAVKEGDAWELNLIIGGSSLLFGYGDGYERWEAYADSCLVKRWYQSAKGTSQIRNDIVYDYNFEIRDPYKYSDCIRLMSTTDTRGQVKKITTFNGKTKPELNESYLGDVLVEKEVNPLRPQALTVNKSNKWLNGTQIDETHVFDDWGNLIYHKTSGGDYKSTDDDLEEWFVYTNATPSTDSALKPADLPDGLHGNPFGSDDAVDSELHDRLIRHIVKISTPVVNSDGNPGVRYQEEYNHYDTYGRLDKSAEWSGQKWLITSYSYDDGSLKPKTVTDSSNQVTTMGYDSLGNLIKAVKGVADSDGNKEIITREWGYDQLWGWKVWERDGRGYVTTYNYTTDDGTIDYKGRVRILELPKDDDLEKYNGWRPNSGELRAGHPLIHTNYDDTNQKKTVLDPLGNKVEYQFDAFGTLAKTIKYSKTNGGEQPYAITGIEYNALGQIQSIVKPKGMVNESEAYKDTTRFEYNDLGDITKVIYPDETSNVIDNPYKYYGYDYTTGTVTITNERGFKTTEHLDALGRLVRREVEKANYLNQTAVTIFNYDGSGNQVRIADPNSNQTLTLFNELGLVSQIKYTQDTFWENDQSITVSPTVEYQYNDLGLKQYEIRTIAGEKNQKTEFHYDELGRLIKGTVNCSPEKQAITRTYYDGNGNKIKVIDANNKSTVYSYSAINKLLTVTDPENHQTRYEYDAAGNKISETNALNQTTWFIYDSLNRLEHKVLADVTPPSNPFTNPEDNPVVIYTYDQNDNVLTESTRKNLQSEGKLTTYTYYPRDFVKSETVGAENGLTGPTISTEYGYDGCGNLEWKMDGLNNKTSYAYDALNRQVGITDPEQHKTVLHYDFFGNKVEEIDSNLKLTSYTYNNYNKLTSVTDACKYVTKYAYDRVGNQTQVIMPNNLVTSYYYDDLDRLSAVKDSLNQWTKYDYDLMGNRKEMLDPRGTKWVYDYYGNNLLKKLTLTGSDNKQYTLNYEYDALGNRTRVYDNDGIETNTTYDPDGQNQVGTIKQKFGGRVYLTEYRHDKIGLLTGIKYPEANGDLVYKYNGINQLSEVEGFTKPQGITYYNDGSVCGIQLANGVSTNFNYYMDGKLKDSNTKSTTQDVMNLNYTYDSVGNIKEIKDGFTGRNSTFTYYDNNWLQNEKMTSKFTAEPTSYPGYVEFDNRASKSLDFPVPPQAIVSFDYAASSIGVDFGWNNTNLPTIRKIELIPDKTHQINRLINSGITIYTSSDNVKFTLIPRSGWAFVKDSTGVITITLNTPVKTRIIKVHCLHNDTTEDGASINKATFVNELSKIIRVFAEVDGTKDTDYQYDSAGNRKLETVTLTTAEENRYIYYPNSNRLLTDGKYVYVYDNAGNLVEKGNKYSVSNDKVEFTEKTGAGVEYWQYEYDLMNRMRVVRKNGETIAQYIYNPDGLRVGKITDTGVTHYVFDGTDPIFEKQIKSGRIKSYIYALDKHIARVDGAVGDSTSQTYYYHTDHLGSIRALTDQQGKVVFDADYSAFGTQSCQTGNIEEFHSFTGKELDPDTGLYYYNARWYDSELGRFVSEDPGNDPNSPNLYAYGSNNPLVYIDPTGMFLEELKNSWFGNGWKTDNEVWEYKDNIAYAERNFVGFRYDYNSKLNLEGQVQLHLYKDVLLQDLKKENKNASLPEKLGNNFEYNMNVDGLRDVLMYLQFETDLYNITHKNKRSYIYTGSQIEAASTKVAIGEALITAGLIEVINNTSIVNRSSLGRLDLQFFANKDAKTDSMFSEKAFEHIFHGNINGAGRPSGYHHSSLMSEATLSNISEPNKFGVYTATIDINGKTKMSSFFPENWSRVEVMNSIKEARYNVKFNGAGWYTGKTNSGMLIKMWINNAGKIDTAFPIY